jgi:hypothetical protein
LCVGSLQSAEFKVFSQRRAKASSCTSHPSAVLKAGNKAKGPTRQPQNAENSMGGESAALLSHVKSLMQLETRIQAEQQLSHREAEQLLQHIRPHDSGPTELAKVTAGHNSKGQKRENTATTSGMPKRARATLNAPDAAGAPIHMLANAADSGINQRGSIVSTIGTGNAGYSTPNSEPTSEPHNILLMLAARPPVSQAPVLTPQSVFLGAHHESEQQLSHREAEQLLQHIRPHDSGPTELAKVTAGHNSKGQKRENTATTRGMPKRAHESETNQFLLRCAAATRITSDCGVALVAKSTKQ